MEVTNSEAARILVADDDDDILALVEFKLSREGHEVIEARNGEEALELARERQPNLAILDVRMPKLDGYELTKKIRDTEAIADMPVILLSASVQDAQIQRGLEAGASDYMRKPFSPQELMEHVEAALVKSRA